MEKIYLNNPAFAEGTGHNDKARKIFWDSQINFINRFLPNNMQIKDGDIEYFYKIISNPSNILYILNEIQEII